MNKPVMYIMLGLPGSGKSTYVNEHFIPSGVQVLCADDLRLAHGHRFYGPLEQQIHGMLYTLARAHMLRGLDVAVDECTVRASYVRRWMRLADDMGYTVRVVHLKTPREICVERRRASSPDFPLEVIEAKERDLARNLPEIKAMLGDGEYLEVA